MTALSLGRLSRSGFQSFIRCSLLLAAVFFASLTFAMPQLVMAQNLAATDHSCAILTTGEVQCWGRNNFGQLGNGTTDDSDIPVTVSGITNAEAVTTGFWHTCALLDTGDVKCWGRNNSAQLGNETNAYTDNAVTTPVSVNEISNVAAIAVGGFHTCAVLTGGQVKCWGGNFSGQLGDNNTMDTFSPISVIGITNAKAVAGGWAHTCATLDTDEIQCWGSNYYGQLGDNTTED